MPTPTTPVNATDPATSSAATPPATAAPTGGVFRRKIGDAVTVDATQFRTVTLGEAIAAAVNSYPAATTATATEVAAAPAAPTAAAGAGEKIDGIPAELQAYGNGKIPADALEPLGVGNHRLYAPAAQAYRRMVDAAKADGITIGITDSYRPYEVQVDLVRRKGLYKNGGLAAVPGTSEHGWGLAADLDLNSDALAWMRTNAKRFGFVEDTPREPWHWGYHGTTDGTQAR